MQHMLGGQFRSKTKEKRGNNNHQRVGPSGNCRTKKTGKVSCEKMTINYFIIFPTAVFLDIRYAN